VRKLAPSLRSSDRTVRSHPSAPTRRAGSIRRAGAVALLGLAALLVLALAACGQAAERSLLITAVSSVSPAAGSTVSAKATRAIIPTPLASATLAPPTASPSEPASPWPAFLSELNLGIPAGNSYGPRALAIHPGLDRIYARTRPQANGAPGRVTVLDRTNGRVLDIAETGLDGYADGDLAVDTLRDRLYAVNKDDTTCSVLDAGTLDLLTTLEGVDQLALDAESGRLFVAGLGGLRILDVEGYGILKQAPVPRASRFLFLAIGPAPGSLSLAYQDAEGYVLAQYDKATLQELATTRLPGPPDDLEPDQNRDRAYVTLNDGERNLLWVVDQKGRVLEERKLGDWSHETHLALDPAGDRLFLGHEAYQHNGIAVLDLTTDQETADWPLAASPNALAWDAEAGQLLVSHTYADKIRVVDPDTGSTVSVYPTALDLVDLEVDPERGHLLATDTGGRLRVLDAETGEELAILPADGTISVDGPHGRLYVGGQGADRVRVFDASTLQQTGEIQTSASPVADAYYGGLYLVESGIYLASLDTMTITRAIPGTLPPDPGYPGPAAVNAVVDAGSGRVFAIINNGTPGSNGGTYLYVYEPETYQQVLTDTERSPIYVDVDPTTGRAYVSRIHMAGQSTGLLEDGREYTARLDAVFGALRVDPALGRVFLTVSGEDEGDLLVLDAENLDVLGSVPIPGNFSLRALDPQTHLLYLATQDGHVQIWSATGGAPASPAQPARANPTAQEIHGLFLGPQDTPLFTGSLYRSDDEGRSWQAVDEGLPRQGVQEVVVSPGFAQDETLFAVTFATGEGLGIWKSIDGGRSWRMANRGLSDLAVNDLAISPGYAVDQTLFATTRRQGLFRSTDGGDNWIPLTERYHSSETYPEAPYGVYVSPTYARDQTVFVAHYGLWRSTDGGETWQRVLPEEASLDFSPEFATDRTLFGWSDSVGVLRSTDGGDTWQPAGTGLTLADPGSARVIVAPDYPASQTVYLILTPTSPDSPARFFRSMDAARTWQRLAGDPPHAATPVQLSADGTAFITLDGQGRLVRWPVRELTWQAANLPPLDQLTVDRLLLSPNFVQDHTLFALITGGSILRSADAGLTWTDTGFPLRTTYGTMLEPVLVSPQTLLVGTPLGLYESYHAGPWAQVGGGLPQGAAPSTPRIGVDGSLSVLVAGTDEGNPARLFLSTDGGQTWTQPVPDLPQPVTLEDLRFSPAFATDHTAFVASSWEKPWRSLHGGEWQRFGPPGDGSLSAFQLSPSFDRDGLIFMVVQDYSLWRSADGGDTWSQVSVPWGGEPPIAVSPGTGYLLDALTFSPAFTQDGVILTWAANGLYRSADRGATWRKVLDLAPSLIQAVFAPGYAQNGQIYLLQGRTVYRSADRGQSWQALSPAPWDESDEVTLLLSPAFAKDRTMLAWTRAGRVFQSRDAGKSWHGIGDDLPSTTIQQVLFSPGYATDQLIYLVPFGPGLYKRLGDSAWLKATTEVPLSSPSASPSAVPTRAVRPTSTPKPLDCSLKPALFRKVWQQARARLGCPKQQAVPVMLAEQPFERGRMIWDSSNRQIYVLSESGTWQSFEDTFSEGVDPAYDPALPPPPRQPQRGFGKVWREQLGGPQADIGWALEGERAVDGRREPFEHGLLIWTDDTLTKAHIQGTAYLLYDDGTWQAIAAPGS
jgi:photosystem II stability/assembly factor-like uncharacterized protein/DNA-binding beta-propeller fold protein YncE